MHKPLTLRTGASLVTIAMLTMLFVSLRAQQPPARGAAPAAAEPATPAAPAGRGAAPAAPAPKPLVPVATNTIAAKPRRVLRPGGDHHRVDRADLHEVVVRR